MQKKEQEKAKQLENRYNNYINTDDVENFDDFQVPTAGNTIEI